MRTAPAPSRATIAEPEARRQLGEEVGDARDGDLRLLEQLEVVAIAQGAQRLDPRRRNAARFGEVPDPHPVAQQAVDVGRLVEHRPDGGAPRGWRGSRAARCRRARRRCRTGSRRTSWVRELRRRWGRLDVVELAQVEQQMTVGRLAEHVRHPVPPEDVAREIAVPAVHHLHRGVVEPHHLHVIKPISLAASVAALAAQRIAVPIDDVKHVPGARE